MTIKNATKENNQVKIVVEVDAAKFEEGINKAYLKARKNIAIPGFRKGKAPRKMVEVMYGAEIFYEDGLNEIFPDIYKEAVLDQGWKAVGQPSVTDVQFHEDKSVELTIESALYPDITLGEYKGIEVPKATAEVTDEEVEAEVDRRANDAARICTVDRAAEEGDTAVIDFEGFTDGVAFEGGKGENYDLKLGSHTFIPGFEEQLIGVTAGEEKDIEVTFPEDYNEKLAGKAAVFKVKVHEIKQTIVPEKDDELAKDISAFDTMQQLRDDIRATILKQKQDGIQKAFENAALEQAAKNMTVDIPECMIDDQVEKEMERFDYQLRTQGASLEQYAKMLGGDLSGFRSSIRPSAEAQLRVELMLNAVVDAEKIEVSDEELAAEYARLAEAYQMDVEKIKSMISDEDMKGDVAVRKASELIADSAVAVAPKEEVSEEAPKKPARKRTTKKAAPAEEATDEQEVKPEE